MFVFLIIYLCFYAFVNMPMSLSQILMLLFFFLDFSPDGRPQWEVEAKIIREKTQGVSPCFLLFEKKSVKIM